MNIPFRKLLSFAASIGILGFSVGSAFGQQAKVVGEKATSDDIQSPEFSGGKQKSFKPKEWLEVEAKLKISMSPEPKSKTCEKLTVKWYVLVKNPEKSGTMLLLTKEVEHVNAPLDEDVYCSVYLSPASIKRLTGSNRGGKGTVEAVGYEVLVNGEKVAAETTRYKVGWWNATTEKMSRNDTIPLLNKTETPFRAMWWDRYAEVSETRGK